MNGLHRVLAGLALAALLPVASPAPPGAGPTPLLGQEPTSSEPAALPSLPSSDGPAATQPDARSPEPDPAVHQELERGRFWHASRLLAREGADSVDPLLRARAEAGWGNWAAVDELVAGVEESGGAVAAELQALAARAAEERGRSREAAVRYRRALEGADELPAGESRVARLRLVRVLAASGSFAEALEEMEDLTAEDPWAASWLALEVARRAADEGRVGPARRAARLVTAPEARRRDRGIVGEAHLAAGDTASALAAFLERAAEADEPGVWSRIGRIRLARGDSASAARAFRNGLRRGGDADGARALLELGVADGAEALRLFEVLRRAGDDAAALEALERHAERTDGEPLPDSLRLSRARLLRNVERRAEAVDELRELASRSRPEVAAPALDLWWRIRREQGRSGDARILQDRLVERFPSRPEAVDVIFFRADDRHDRMDLAGALAGYGRAAGMAPALDRAGAARMRMGQIHLTEGRFAEAARVYEGYLEDFPRGRRTDEARYWAAWSRTAAGDEETARGHLRSLREREPLSYYAVLGSRLEGRAFAPAIPEGSPPPPVPAVAEELERLDLLRRAGLEDAVPARIDRLRRRYRASSDTLLRLSLELSERGFSLEGIRLAWELRDRGRDWDRWLVRAVYPFPYRELVRLEADEWGLEPAYVAALIRQESAFLAQARSGAGALGLMQVIPSTGRSVAGAVGPEPFSDALLLRPEVNLHLGTAFLARLHERFGEGSPLALAAYNAGPTRARRWSRTFPEADDPVRFTERIPFPETRGYVKRVERNVEIYRWLYGEEL